MHWIDGCPGDGLQSRLSRRGIIGLATLSVLSGPRRASAAEGPLRFGLTPVFLNNDIELLSRLKDYFSLQTGRDVQLVQRRT